MNHIVLQVEDPEDEEQLISMIDPLPPDQCYISNCQNVPGVAVLIKPLQVCPIIVLWIRYNLIISNEALLLYKKDTHLLSCSNIHNSFSGIKM